MRIAPGAADDAKLAISAQRLYSGKGFDAEKATRDIRRLELATVPTSVGAATADSYPSDDVDTFLQRQHRHAISVAIRDVRGLARRRAWPDCCASCTPAVMNPAVGL
jgi:hypothetical protein